MAPRPCDLSVDITQVLSAVGTIVGPVLGAVAQRWAARPHLLRHWHTATTEWKFCLPFLLCSVLLIPPAMALGRARDVEVLSTTVAPPR